MRLACGIPLLALLASLEMYIGFVDDANKLRKACPTIGGNLNIDLVLNESINLDGIETVLGDIVNIPYEEPGMTCGTPRKKLYNLSSSTLATVKAFVLTLQLRIANVRANDRIILPLGNASDISIYFSSTYIKGFAMVVLPSEAEHWGETSFRMDRVDFREYDDDGSKIWHWPRHMRHVYLDGRVQNNFFPVDAGAISTSS
ncbi:hypothetical protein BGZ63DRAFT_403894 [Mariannaea sp. PMI_226]|nr:hypothetical protein BGZ63DRAFT_403894 [Mariannaea sp. PMI_226]